ncbi:MAG: hypothetical protein V1908_04760, partial [Candidatus Peregrinibacteria bacterium]
MPKISKKQYPLLLTLVISILLLGLSSIAIVKAFISNGGNATDVIGQTDVDTGLITYTKHGANNGPKNNGFDSASYIAIDTTNHRLFVSDYENNRVLVFNLTVGNTLPDYVADNVLGQIDFTSGNNSLTQSTFNRPQGLAYDSTGNRLFVADSENNRVLVFNLTDGITNGEAAMNVLGASSFTSWGGGITQSKFYLTGLTYDGVSGRLFVADNIGARVLVFDVASITDGENAVNVLGQIDFTSLGVATTQNKLNEPN